MSVADYMSQTSGSRRVSISDTLTQIGGKISRVLTSESRVTATETATNDRSQSRGRAALTSHGRGGAGNIRSMSRDPASTLPEVIEDDGGVPRGREVTVSAKAISSGRGGAGNIRRSPSAQAGGATSPPKANTPTRQVSRSISRAPQDIQDRNVLARRLAEAQSEVRSSGRGGAGNIVNRSLSRGPALASSPTRRTQASA